MKNNNLSILFTKLINIIKSTNFLQGKVYALRLFLQFFNVKLLKFAHPRNSNAPKKC